MFNKHNPKKNQCMLNGTFALRGYDWWWHSFTAVNEETGEEKQFFFEFFLINPLRGRKGVRYGQTGHKPSYLMVKCGAWGTDHTQLHRFYPFSKVKLIKKAPFSIETDECFLNNEMSRGHVKVSRNDSMNRKEWMCDFGEMSWDLKITKEIAYNVGYGTCGLFRFLKAFQMYWHAEGIKSYYEGTVTFNGKKYIATKERSFGYADKNWGSNFTSPWIWLASSDLTSSLSGKRLENSAFDVGGGRPKIYFVPLNKKLLGGFYYEGKEYEFNFSKFWTGSKTKFDCKILSDKVTWNITLKTRKAKMVMDISSAKNTMLLVNYESPDGKKRHNNLYNGGNGEGRILLYERKGKKETLIDDIQARHIGCEFGEYDKKEKN